MLKIKQNKIMDEIHLQRISIPEIATKLRVTTRTLYNIIRNKNNPSLPLAQSIARCLNKDINNLFEFEEE
jgi:DNA-binding XRE family transcriptional regulator